MLPTGNGMYIWLMDRCAGGNPQRIAERAEQSGLKWVAIKIANGTLPFGSFAQNKAVVEALHARNIAVWGWHYIYGHAPTREAEVAAQQTSLLGVDGYIINAEVEYKKPGMNLVAREYMNVLKALIRRPIGLTSFRFPSYHREFPWAEFIPRVDFNQPQVYWIGAHNAGQQLRKALVESLAMAPNLPVIPLGAAFTEWGWNPTKSEILDFRVTARDLKLPGYGWWEWYHAETKNPMWWEAATQPLDGEPQPENPGETPVPVPAPEYIATPFTTLRVRSAPSLTGEILGYLPRFTVLEVLERQDAWARTKHGWAHSGFTNRAYKVMTRYANLRIRSGPSLNAAVLGYLEDQVEHFIVAESGAWGRLEGATERWVHLDYVNKL